MSLPTLYELSQDLIALMEMNDDETTAALTRITAGQIELKSESYCKFVKYLESSAESFKAEEKRIAERRRALENKADRIRQYMKDALLSAGIDKVDAGTFSVRVGLSQGSLQIDDQSKLPPKYIKIIQDVDKAAIKQAIKNGEVVPGAHIEAGTTLTIR